MSGSRRGNKKGRVHSPTFFWAAISARISASVPKEMAAAFKERCLERGVPQAQVIKAAIERFLEETEKDKSTY